MHDIGALRRVSEYSSDHPERVLANKRWRKDMERRAGPRYPYSAEGTATVAERTEEAPLDMEPDFPVIALSLSRGGISFLANYELQNGDVVELRLPTADAEHKCLRIRVIRHKRVGMNAFEIGATFVETQA